MQLLTFAGSSAAVLLLADLAHQCRPIVRCMHQHAHKVGASQDAKVSMTYSVLLVLQQGIMRGAWARMALPINDIMFSHMVLLVERRMTYPMTRVDMCCLHVRAGDHA